MAQGLIPYYDIALDRDDLDKDAMRLLASIRPAWKPEELRIERFSEGYMNHMACFYHVDDTERSDAIVIRVPGDFSTVVNDYTREGEFIAMQLGNAAGCFPALLAVFKNGVAYRYVRGKTLKPTDMHNPEIIRKITRKLLALHRLDPHNVALANCEGKTIPYRLDRTVFSRARHCSPGVPDKLEDPAKDAVYREYRLTKDEILAEFDGMQRTVEKLGLSTCFSHHDIHMKNIVYDETSGEITFVDWDFSGVHYEMTDLAYVFALRPFLELLGMYKSEEPDFSPEVRSLWIRSYVEASYEHEGHDVSAISDAAYELADVECAILEVYMVLLYIMFCEMFLGFNSDHFPGNPLPPLATYKLRFDQGKRDMGSLVERHRKLKETCQKTT